MAKDPRELLNDLEEGRTALGKADSQRMQAFSNFIQTTTNPGAIDSKTKHLIGLAIGLYTHCEYCIAAHTNEALEAGATREELIETAFVAASMGGGPVIGYSATLLVDAINTFAPDYGK